MKKMGVAVAILLQFTFISVTRACDIEKPKGEAILVVDGMIGACNDPLEVRLDRVMIEALPHREIKTENPWDTGITSYEGVLLRDLMKYVKAKGTTASFVALNDYSSEIPLADIDKIDVILAYRRGGEYLSVRDKGPFFVVFPFTDVPALKTEARYGQSVWQVNHIVVK